MAETLLAKGTISSTTITAGLVTASQGTVVGISGFVLTNTAATYNAATIYTSQGGSDEELAKVSLPPYVGAARLIYEALGPLSAGESVKIKLDSASSVNYRITGEISFV